MALVLVIFAIALSRRCGPDRVGDYVGDGFIGGSFNSNEGGDSGGNGDYGGGGFGGDGGGGGG